MGTILWHRHAEDIDGYWGAPTSTIDWCEENYAHSRYVAEFCNKSTFIFLGNATTSLLTVILCTGIALDHMRRGSRFRFVMAYVWIAVTGVGSVLFHSTLKYETQLLDEIPMLFLISHLFFCM
jgi:dihydroceramidase